MKDLIIIAAYCPDERRENILRNLVNSFDSERGHFDIMIVSHTPVPLDIQRKVEFFLYDKKNELLEGKDFIGKPWFSPVDDLVIESSLTSSKSTHLAIWRMLILGYSLAEQLGYEKIHNLEYDTILNNLDEFLENSSHLNIYDAITYYLDDGAMYGSYQAFNLSKISPRLKKLDEEWIKEEIRNSYSKSCENTFRQLISLNNNHLEKSAKSLQKNNNSFGIFDSQIDVNLTPWAVPYYDATDDSIMFIVWNHKRKRPINVDVVVNKEYVVNFENIQEDGWEFKYLCKAEELRTLTIIEDSAIRDVHTINNKEDLEIFKKTSFRKI